jgi:D-alanyl-D-alanine-carboxypeptidase/D-alanyl-D-alanine-endopeptidase
MLRRCSAVLCTFALCLAGASQAATPSGPPTDAEIRQMLVNRIDIDRQSVGIVVGVIDAKGRRIISYGHLEKGDDRPLNGDTVFEIGSITKVFTALLLTDMVQRGEAKLDDPIAKYLSSSAKVPDRDGRAITLVDLATHTSALPSVPTNFRPKDASNPYADYTSEQLYAFLSSYQLIRDPGVKFEYSNLGFGLLGEGLARRAGTDYETLVETRICKPLGMTSTRITMSEDMERRFAAGHSSDLATVSRWDIPTLAGAGALRSTANDLMKFLAAVLGYTKTPLDPAMRAMLTVSRPTGQPFIDSALGWAVDTRGGDRIIWKNGGTGGYRTFIGYMPQRGLGIVALSNASTGPGVDDLGLHLFDARYPLSVPDGSPRTVAVDQRSLEGYLGRYKLTPTFIFTVTREGDQLYVQATGQPRAAVYPSGDREFFYKVVHAQITFEADGQGRIVGLVLHQNGRDQSAKRIDEAEARALEDAVASRFKDQTAMPGSEAATRRFLEQLQRHHVDYDQLTPEFAVINRQNESLAEASIASYGALQSLTFKGVGPGGADIYELKFENGAIDWRIVLAPDGKVAGVSFHKLP